MPKCQATLFNVLAPYVIARPDVDTTSTLDDDAAENVVGEQFHDLNSRVSSILVRALEQVSYVISTFLFIFLIQIVSNNA